MRVLRVVAAALRDAQVLVEDYAGYDDHAARRRIARRLVAGEARQEAGSRSGGRSETALNPPWEVTVRGPRTEPGMDGLVLDAACHVRAARGLDLLAWRLVKDQDLTLQALEANAWPLGRKSALLFGALLYLGGRLEGAQFWFQYAAGAESTTAARCLYLLHLTRGEVRTARHWKQQMLELQPESGVPDLPPLPGRLEEALGASVMWTSPPITTQDLTFLSLGSRGSQFGGQEQERRALPGPLHRAVAALVAEEDADLGEVLRPSTELATELSCFRDRIRRQTMQGAGAWSSAALRSPAITQAVQQIPDRPTPTALAEVHRALRVLEVIGRYSGGVSTAQIARETRLPQLILAEILALLVRDNLAHRIGPSAYITGSALHFTAAAAQRTGQLQQTLALVRDAVGAAVYVSRYSDGEVAITQYADAPHAPKVTEWVDFRAAAHASAVGKCLLTQLDYDGRKDHLTRHHTARLTSRTITSERALFHQLDTRPLENPVLDLQEYSMGTVCAAIPITKGLTPECVALSLPVQHAHRLRMAARILQDEAAAVLLGILIAGTSEAVGDRTPTPPAAQPHRPPRELVPPTWGEPAQGTQGSVSLAAR